MDARALEQSWMRVRQLAKRFPDDWGGEDLEGEDPLRIFAGTPAPRRVLVVTQEAALRRWSSSDWPNGLVVVVAVGMLTRSQAAVLERLATDKSVPIAFLGSADPMCLHTYLSLRVHLGARRIRYCGVGDALLDLIGSEAVQPDRLSTRVFSAFDREHLRVVEKLVKPQEILGPRVSAVMGKGKKIGIEHLGFRADLIPALFKAALKVAWDRRGRL